jgi:hypothetical protein
LGHKVENYTGEHRTIGEIKNTRRNIGDNRRNNMSGTRKSSGKIGKNARGMVKGRPGIFFKNKTACNVLYSDKKH